jgi:hypothetical protein
MNHERFKKEMRIQGIIRGSFIICYTKNSICTGYVEGVCYPTRLRGFVNLAGTRKINQGRKEDWYDHIYSVRLSRIRRVISIDPLTSPNGRIFYPPTRAHQLMERLDSGSRV